MIRLLDSFSGEGLRDSHYSKTIASHLSVYGTEFDFCRFYEIFRRKRVGLICAFNGTVTADFCEGAKCTSELRREVAEFIDFQSPNVAELPKELVPKRGLSGYESVRRRFYELPAAEDSDGLIEPEASGVYDILGAPREAYGLWLTDVMRRKNRGQLWFYGYESAVLCVRFSVGGAAYITDLATPEADRGRGYARTLLQKTSRIFSENGAKAYVASRAELFTFYERIGCANIGEDKIFIKKG